MRKSRKAGALVAGLALLTGGLVAGVGAQSASAAGCYDGAITHVVRAGELWSPRGDGKWKTTSACNDINVRLSSGATNGDRLVHVCFYPSSGGESCQSRDTRVSPGEWTVVASNVKDGTKFKLRWSSRYRVGYSVKVAR